MDDTWKPFSIFPARDHMHYWRDLLTLIILALAFPYMVRLAVKRPGTAAALSSAV